MAVRCQANHYLSKSTASRENILALVETVVSQVGSRNHENNGSLMNIRPKSIVYLTSKGRKEGSR